MNKQNITKEEKNRESMQFEIPYNLANFSTKISSFHFGNVDISIYSLKSNSNLPQVKRMRHFSHFQPSVLVFFCDVC